MYALQQHQLLYLYPELVCPSQLKDPLVESYVCPTAAQLNDPLIESYVCPTAAQLNDPLIESYVCPTAAQLNDPLIESYVCPTAAQLNDPLIESYVCPTAAPVIISLPGVGLPLTTKRSPGREFYMPYSSTSYYIFTRSWLVPHN